MTIDYQMTNDEVVDAQVVKPNKSSRLPRLRKPRIKKIAGALVLMAGSWVASENYNKTPGTSCSDGTTTISATSSGDGRSMTLTANGKKGSDVKLGNNVVKLAPGESVHLFRNDVPTTNIVIEGGQDGATCTLTF